jgi:hypothetical protein
MPSHELHNREAMKHRRLRQIQEHCEGTRPEKRANHRQDRQWRRVGDGRTLSVVNDMPRKSPVIMMITVSRGVRIACPVMVRPKAKKKHLDDYLGEGVQRVGQYALKRHSPFFDRGDDPARPGSVNTMPAA